MSVQSREEDLEYLRRRKDFVLEVFPEFASLFVGISAFNDDELTHYVETQRQLEGTLDRHLESYKHTQEMINRLSK